MSRRTAKPSFFRRFLGWVRREEQYEKETFVEGIANVDSVFGAIVHGLGSALAWPFVASGRLVRRTLQGIRRGVRKAIRELGVVLGEIVHDLRQLAGKVLRAAPKPCEKAGCCAEPPSEGVGKPRLFLQKHTVILRDRTPERS
jgi:hypothetical protein